MNIITVKHGKKYRAKHVNYLQEQLMEYYPTADYFCYTEDPTDVDCETIPVFNKPLVNKWWNKLALFSIDMPFKGPCLYFDLDILVEADPHWYLQWDGLSLISAYWKRDDPQYYVKHRYDTVINSSCMTWHAEQHNYIWELFLSNYDYYTRKYAGIDRFIFHEDIKYNLFEDGLMDSVSNPKFPDAPIKSWNNLEYVL